jgi:hypothetical protein
MANVTIITNDGTEKIIPEYIAHKFITLNDLMEYNKEDEAIPLPSISAQIFNGILNYLNHFIEINDPMMEFTGFGKNKDEQVKQDQDKTYYKWVIHKKYLSQWETDYFDGVDDDTLGELWKAADYLNCPFLLDSFSVESGWRKVRGKGKPFNSGIAPPASAASA